MSSGKCPGGTYPGGGGLSSHLPMGIDRDSKLPPGAT